MLYKDLNVSDFRSMSLELLYKMTIKYVCLMDAHEYTFLFYDLIMCELQLR